MSASTAIGSVSTTLQKLLRDRMQLAPAVNVTLLGPDESGPDRRVNLFLYRVEENSFLKNQEPMVSPAAPNRVLPPPLSLDLYYLMTVYAPNDADTGNAEAHHILGEAMRVLHDNSPVPRAQLLDDLGEARELLQIAARQPDHDELTTMWTTFSKPYRPCVLYQVSTVQLDGAPDTASDAAQRVRRIGVPDIGQPVQPPAIDQLTPPAGAAGALVTLHGHHLAGQRVAVTVGATPAVEVLADNDTITVPIPAGLPAGGYEVVVDIAKVFRRTFLFEVTT
jgi:hypothetical protein